MSPKFVAIGEATCDSKPNTDSIICFANIITSIQIALHIIIVFAFFDESSLGLISILNVRISASINNTHTTSVINVLRKGNMSL